MPTGPLPSQPFGDKDVTERLAIAKDNPQLVTVLILVTIYGTQLKKTTLVDEALEPLCCFGP